MREFLRSIRKTKEIAVRINSMDGNLWKRDLEAVVCPALDAVVLPKARAGDAVALSAVLTEMERERKPASRTGIIALVETAAAVSETEEIAALPRVNAIMLGAEDLSADIGAERTPSGEEILYPRMRVVYACAAAGIDSVDTPFTDVRDGEGLRKDCLYARRLGFSAKAAVHPSQASVINECFLPSPASVAKAARILRAREAAGGKGVFSVDGKMVDRPVLERAERTLAAAREAGLPVPEE